MQKIQSPSADVILRMHFDMATLCLDTASEADLEIIHRFCKKILDAFNLTNAPFISSTDSLKIIAGLGSHTVP